MHLESVIDSLVSLEVFAGIVIKCGFSFALTCRNGFVGDSLEASQCPQTIGISVTVAYTTFQGKNLKTIIDITIQHQSIYIMSCDTKTILTNAETGGITCAAWDARTAISLKAYKTIGTIAITIAI